jgi:hypothetical protein
MNSLIEKIGRQTLSAEERFKLSTTWKDLTPLEKLEVACRVRGVGRSETDAAMLYIETIEILEDLEKRYV